MPPFSFAPAPDQNGELRQGELLGDVYVHHALANAAELEAGTQPEVNSTKHPLAVVLHSDCDLQRDFDARRRAHDGGAELNPWSDKNAAPQILLLAVFAEGEIKPRAGSTDLWKRIRQNENERYHYLEFNPIEAPTAPGSPLLLDFRKVFTVFTEDVYGAIAQGKIHRWGMIPPIFLHDVMQRCFSYLSRVGLPDA